jgi:hypothetical protein
MPQYFDIRLLGDYLEMGLEFKVYVNGEYVRVDDPYSLKDKKIGLGYDFDGKPVKFRFMDIDHIKVGSNVLTKQDLIDLEKPEEPEEPEGEEFGDEQEPGDQEPELKNEPVPGEEKESKSKNPFKEKE